MNLDVPLHKQTRLGGAGELARFALAALFLAAVILSLITWRLDLLHYNLRAPLNYAGDTLSQLLYVKGLLQDGWTGTITHLSAPFTYPGAAFPLQTSTDWMLMKVMSVFSKDPGLLLNAFWLLTLVMNGWSAAYASWQLRLPAALSLANGVLYAFLPYGLMRNLAHVNLVFYVVPLLCLLAVVIASRGEGVRRPGQAVVAGLAACVLQGFDYVYYSFFAAALFCLAALIGFRGRDLRQLKLPVLAVAVLSICTAINLFPGLQSWKKDGLPPEMSYKLPAEAEVYGVKLRRMILPQVANPVPFLAAWAEKDLNANFPDENENTSARLGIYGALGLLLILVSLLRASRKSAVEQPMRAITGLSLATFLFITVGGLGAVFNLLVSPDIRAYNRFVVFLDFFCIVALSMGFARGLAGLGQGRLNVRTMACGIAAAALVVFSLHDQLLDTVVLTATQRQGEREAAAERQAVATLEHALPPGTALLQLPFFGYPINYHQHEMDSYDHVRPYLWSTSLKWSWPSFSLPHRAWQDTMGELKGKEFVDAAILSGFGAIWIDRKGYADGGEQLLKSLTVDGVRRIDVGHPRYAVLDLAEAAASLRSQLGQAEFARRADLLIGPKVNANWLDGFYAEERRPDGIRFHWSKKHAFMELRNPGDEPMTACIAFDVVAPTGPMRISGKEMQREVAGGMAPQRVSALLHMDPREVRRIDFASQSPPIVAPGDPRSMVFTVMSFDLATMRKGSNPAVACNGQNN
ncbi:hypothetical protein [Noviherbaspirillum galbum]|uniref:YfhO family protein n=1 Tax=Noviherbaspirillum galbum TaxID=2709383 RepID=A0A6B3SK13_9BURK|nr:hypothetical protein [Noviherbaspirillum galbum]NEX60888.1 hypothetical protein [Noviherbaspirillum galbum]